jgi:hypothetical protein
VTLSTILERITLNALLLVLLSGLTLFVLVAAIAGVLHVAARVAAATGDLTLPAMIQGEAVHAQESRIPCLGGVAVLAVESKEPGMNSWLSVALNAYIGRSGKDSFAMTILAGNLGVPPLERKDGCMRKIRHAIDAIVARGAVSPILLLVLEHKSRPLFPLGMATHATTRIETLGITQVAVIARQGAAIIVLLVASQAKTCLSSMLKRRSNPARWRPSVWGVAGITLARGHAHVRVILVMAACTVWLGASE